MNINLLGVIERLLLINPVDPFLIRDRGLVFYALKRYVAAYQDLKKYLQMRPGADEVEYVKELIKTTRQHIGSLN